MMKPKDIFALCTALLLVMLSHSSGLAQSQFRIVFLAEIGQDSTQAWSIKTDGTDLQQVTDTIRELQERNASGIACSPDSTQVAFTANGLYISNLEGSNVRLVNREGLYDWVDWSPQGGKLAFIGSLIRDGDSMGELYTINTDGSDLLRVTTNSTADYHPSWSANEQSIAYWYYENGNTGIAVVNADGSNPIRITSMTDAIGSDASPSWSPNGDWIAFSRKSNGTYHLYKIRPDGSDLTQITRGDADDMLPQWSPDAQLLSFSSRRNGDNRQIYTVKPDGTALQQITNRPEDLFNACWLTESSVPPPTPASATATPPSSEPDGAADQRDG